MAGDFQDTRNLDRDQIIADFSPAWLTQALGRRHPGVVVTQSSIAHMLAGTCAKIWLDLVYEASPASASLPRRVLVKGGYGPHAAQMQFTYRLEMLAYRDVLPRHPINAPQCFYAGESPDGKSSVVILEDLNQRSVTFCDALRPLNYQQAADFLAALARFHASSWNRPSLTDGSWPWVQKSEQAGIGSYLERLLQPDVWAAFMEMPRGAAVPKVFSDRDLYVEALPRIAAFNETQPLVVMHGDCHIGNLYLEPDGTPGFLDFQCRVGVWSLSVAYFIASSTDMLDRREWDRKLVAHYLDTLRASGVTPPSFEDAWDSYSRQLVFYLFGWLANGSDFQPENKCAAVVARLAAAVIDSGALSRVGGLGKWTGRYPGL